ncbi:MAG: hypothetical protein WDW36_000255 [Sanguina aurantia]
MYLSACLYLKCQTVSSPAVAIGVACSWNLASIAMCVILDVHNRRTFLRSSGRRRPQGDLPDGGKVKAE